MAQNIFKGLGIALITPFKTDGSVDYQALKRLVEFQIDNGADFLCILATTGEAPCLTKDEKDKITELVKEVNHGRVKILKYCGGNNTAAVVDEIKNTDWSGIDGILSICPYYNKPSQEGLYQHFKAIAEISPLPIVLYNVPGRTGVNMKPETTCRIAREFPNIVAIKEASGSLEQVDEIIKNKPDNFDVISGDDALTFSMIASGAATSLLHGYHIREVAGDTAGCFRLHVDTGSARNIVEHDRQRTNLGDGLEVLIETFLRRFVVVRTDTEDAIDATPVGVLDFFNDSSSIITATIFQYLDATLVHVFHQFCDFIFLFLCKTWSLTSCGKDAKEVCTIVNLKLYQSLERLIINRAIGVERSNKGNT